MGVLSFYFSMLSLLAPLLVVAGVGAVWAKKGHDFPTQFITVLATSVTTPALVFHTLVTTKLSNAVMASIAGATVLALVASMLISAAALKALKLPVRKLLQTTAFPNAGNLGLPISYQAFGDAGLSTAIAFFAVASFMQHTVGLRTLPNTGTIAPAWKNPVLVAAVAAAACRVFGYQPPVWIMESAELLGSMTVPLMLLSLGHALALIPPSGVRVGSVIGSLRLVIGLATGYGAAWLCGLPADVVNSIALQMGMPCAVVSYMYARRYTDMGDAAAGAVLFSTLVFLLLAPLLFWALASPAAR